MAPPLTIAALFVHPVKSCAGITVGAAALTRDGLSPWDRAWAVVKAGDTGRVLTQRDCTALALISTALPAEALLGEGEEAGASLTLTSPGHPPLLVPLTRPPGALRTHASVWEWSGDVDDEGEEAAAWVSGVIGRAARLVRYSPGRAHCRPVAPAWTPQGAPAGAEAAFKDGFPLLVVSASSVADLAARLGRPTLDGRRFRANLVIAGAPAWAEDGWAELAIGEGDGLRIGLTKPCDRCTIPAVNPDSGVVDGKDITPGLRHFRTGAALRWDGVLKAWKNAVFFGWNGALLGGDGGTQEEVVGLVRVGDAVRVVVGRIGPPVPVQ
jgi:uncharacterized protein YcbX